MIHVHTYEKWWIVLTIIMLVAFMGAISISAFAGGIQVPAPFEKVDPKTIAKTAPFDNPGLRELSPGKYEAYILAQASPWKFYPSEIQVPVGATVTFPTRGDETLIAPRTPGGASARVDVPGRGAPAKEKQPVEKRAAARRSVRGRIAESAFTFRLFHARAGHSVTAVAPASPAPPREVRDRPCSRAKPGPDC